MLTSLCALFLWALALTARCARRAWRWLCLLGGLYLLGYFAARWWMRSLP